jgi:DNA-binding transcriptional LysR family regulator
MTLQELRIFREVVRAGGFTAAADKLGIAKSAVSKQLNRLEQRLQVRLLARSSRRIQLTREGQRLLPRIESILAEGERLIEDAHEEVVRPSGVVRIAASPEFGALVVRRFLPLLLERHPDLSIVMKLEYSFEDLQDPAIDLAFRISHVNDDHLVAKPLGEFRRILVASPGFATIHPLETPADLGSVNCLIFSGSANSTTWTLQHVQQPERIEQVAVRGNIAVLGFHALLGAVESGAGVANVPDFVTTRGIEQGRIVRCLDDWTSMAAPVFLAYRFGAERIGRVRAVIDAVRSAVPGLLSSRLGATVDANGVELDVR